MSFLVYLSREIDSFWVKTENLMGQGVSLVIRGDNANHENSGAMFVSTENKIPITGTRDWSLYQVELPEPVTDNIKSITVFLIFLPNTTGTVCFDDISLVYNNL